MIKATSISGACVKSFKAIFGIIIPVVMSIFAIYSLWQQDNYKTAVRRIEFSESIVQVSKYMAQERGFTYVYAYMSKDGQDLVDIIVGARQQLDKYFINALGYARELEKNDYEKLLEIQGVLEKLRNITEISGKNTRIRLDSKSAVSPIEWFNSISKLISLLEKIHIENLDRLDEDREWLEMPVSIASSNARKAIWRLFELAGQERALIGAAIAYKASIPKEKANARWLGIRGAWLEIRNMMQGRLNNLELASVIEAIENNLFGQYNRIRKQTMDASSDKSVYPLNTREWLTQSTKAIDSLIAMSEILSKNDIQTIADLKLEARKKQKFISIVGIIVIFVMTIVIILYVLILLKFTSKHSVRVGKLYKISENILQSASALALERGISRAVIMSGSKADKNLFLLETIRAQQKTPDSVLLPALEELQSLQIDKHNYLIEGVRKANNKVAELRKITVEYFQSQNMESNPDLAEAVFDDFTNLIEAMEELQLSAAHSFALDGQKTVFLSSYALWHQNLTETAALRHFIWLMSESAGRQRALVGSAISSGTCIPDGKIEELRTMVRSSWDFVKLEIPKGKNNPAVREAMENVRSNFFDGEYPKILKKVVICSKDNPQNPCYDIETDKWFAISSKAIETILKLSGEVGKNSKNELSRMIQLETRRFVLVVMLNIVSIGLMYWAITV